MIYNEINNKRKNRFINILDEKIKLKKYKKVDNRIQQKNIKAIFFPSVNGRIIIPLFILIIIIIFSSTIRKNHKSNIKGTQLQLDNKSKIDKGIKRYSREESLIKGRNFLDKCLEGLLFNNKSFTIINEVKISVIIPVFNSAKMIKSVIRSIQNQKMEDIEIIIVNDFSKDNSLQIIEGMQKEDPRIKIINNEINKGILYSRSIGVLEAKGKYILNLDHDDFFLDEDLFEVLYEESGDYNFDIVSFMEINLKNYNAKIDEMYEGLNLKPDNLTIRGQELILFSLFRNDSFNYNEAHIWGKLFKTEVYKKAINLLGKETYSIYNSINDNLITIFSIYNIAQSYKFIKKYGLFHYLNPLASHRIITNEYKIKMDIFFCNIVFNLTKKEYKKYSVIIALKINPISEDNKNYLRNILKKILDCEYIKENYKDKISKKYEEIGSSY